MQTDFSKFISLVNSAFPVLGIFTWWFQNGILLAKQPVNKRQRNISAVFLFYAITVFAR